MIDGLIQPKNFWRKLTFQKLPFVAGSLKRIAYQNSTTARKDWRGWRMWEESHVKAVLAYKAKRENI